MGVLTVQKLTKLEPGRHLDGDGLYFVVREPNKKGEIKRSWFLRTVVQGKRSDIGLGTFPPVGLAEARDKAMGLRKMAREGGNPLDAKRKDVMTFEDVCRAYYEKEKSKFRSQRHSDQWIASLKQNLFDDYGTRPFNTITAQDYKRMLLPMWTESPHAAKRLKQRLQVIFDYAYLNGHTETETNPLARIHHIMPAVSLKSKNFEAIKWAELPKYFEGIDGKTVPGALFRFIILTATRSTEAREAEWSEIDEEAGIWTIPEDRTKMSREHRVPLTPEMLDVLNPMRGLSEKFVFPSLRLKGEKPIAPNVVINMLSEQTITVHGMRSTFRDWCADHGVSRELAEMSLAHSIESKVERAYMRSDLLERRKPVMENWNAYVCGTNRANNVIPLALGTTG